MENRIRVCHITSIHSCADDRIFGKECEALAAAGYEVHLIAPGGQEKIIGGIALHGAPAIEGDFFRRLKLTAEEYYPLAKEVNAHFYHLHDPELLELGKMLKRAGRVVIYDVRDNVADEIRADQSLGKLKRKFAAMRFEFKEYGLARTFDLVIGADSFIRDRFHHQGCLAVDINDYFSRDERLEIRADFSQKERAVCFIGDISAERGLFEMLDICNKLGCKLFLAGRFPAAADKEAAMKHSAWRLVEHYDVASRENIVKVLERSMAGVVLFHACQKFAEAEPRQFSDYMHGKIPIVCSDFQLWREIVEANQCGTCAPPLDTAAAGDRLNWLLNHRDKAREFGQNGANLAEQRYTWEAEKKKLLTCYQQIADGLKIEKV